MEPKDRTIVYGLIAACIAGILIVGLLLIFVGGTTFSGQGFSEVFFLNSEKLPVVIETGTPLNFSFMVASHYNEKMDYKYDIIAGNTIIQSGAFSLPNDSLSQKDRYNQTISITVLTLNPTLIKIANSSRSETKQTYNGGLGLLLSQNGNGAQVVSDPSHLYYPIQLSVGNEPATLIFTPNNTQTYQTTTTSRTNVGDLQNVGRNAATVNIEGFQISDTGYDISRAIWTIQNDHGIINATSITVTDSYRYEYEKIAVEMEAYPANNPDTVTKYEIDFWVIISGKPLVVNDH